MNKSTRRCRLFKRYHNDICATTSNNRFNDENNEIHHIAFTKLNFKIFNIRINSAKITWALEAFDLCHTHKRG